MPNDALVWIIAIGAVYYTVKWLLVIYNNKINGTKDTFE